MCSFCKQFCVQTEKDVGETHKAGQLIGHFFGNKHVIESYASDLKLMFVTYTFCVILNLQV